jgi:hypothetical protein
VPSQYELEPEKTPRYWQQSSGDGKQNANKMSAMRQLEARGKAGEKDALEELQAMVMASLLSEMDSEPEDELRTSRLEASRRAAYAKHSPPPRSAVTAPCARSDCPHRHHTKRRRGDQTY